MQIAPGDEVMVVSDGIIEQFGSRPGVPGTLARSSKSRVCSIACRRQSADEVADLFNAVIAARRHRPAQRRRDGGAGEVVSG